MPVLSSTLITEAKRRADMTHGGIVSTDAEWLSLLNAGYLDLWDQVLQAFGDAFSSSATFALAGGAGSGSKYTLPADLLLVRLVERKTGDATQWRNLEPFELSERDNSELCYRVMGGELHFVPEEATAGDYRIWYAPGPTALAVTPSDVSMDAKVERWWPYVANHAAISALAKEETDAPQLQAEQASILKRLAAMVPKHKGKPSTTSTVYNRMGLSWVQGRLQWLP